MSNGLRPDDEIRAAYRAANAAQDASAGTAVRAAVLAAAARAVQARPHPLNVQTQATATIPTWKRFRQPLAVAASVIFGVGIGLSLFRGEDLSVQSQSGRQVAVMQSGEKPEAKPQLETMAHITPARSADASAASSRNVMKETDAPLSIAGTHKPASSISASRIASAEQTAPATSVSRAEQSDPQQAAESKLSVPVQLATKASGAVSPESKHAAMADAIKAPTAPAPMSLNLAARARSSSISQTVWRSPKEWLAYIASLRKNGQTEQADRELDALRQAYPDIAIPPEALP